MKLDKFYHLEYSSYCLHLYCLIHNVSADASFGLLVFGPNSLFNPKAKDASIETL